MPREDAVGEQQRVSAHRQRLLGFLSNGAHIDIQWSHTKR
jgi:hypothetical protein